MKKNIIIIIIENNNLILKINNSNIHNYELNNCIKYGRIINEKKAIKCINDIFERYKLNNIFIKYKVYVIYEPFLQYIDKFIIINVFQNIGIKDIKLVNKKSLINKKYIYLDYCENYTILYKNNRYYIFSINEFNSFEFILKNILNVIIDDILLIKNEEKYIDISKFKNIYYFEIGKKIYFELLYIKCKKNV